MNAANYTPGKTSGHGFWGACIGLMLGIGLSLPTYGQALTRDADASVFEYEERSTIETIPFRSMEEEVLANTVIEGGLAAPAAGVPVQAGKNADFYLDPLALQPRDERTDLGRSEIPVDIRFANPKVVPGQTHSNNYLIRPPQNRTYDALNVNMTERP
ncbi:hypothetical protein MARI_29440 [Marinobacter sp. JH2]|uniref:hypothetical protein n=1 Tax=Marinobacter sp. AL4B TaxID=2871173 RepID=UPI0010C558FA|nr:MULTISPECIES: hypothetical protein [unclassified Marinobacter]MBZ0335192.1 hypothetical protein [Marinobacter sp. AL4B]QBM18801.1 hypothetical protein MARI_29440 [Marinobacter sp. JH2]